MPLWRWTILSFIRAYGIFRYRLLLFKLNLNLIKVFICQSRCIVHVKSYDFRTTRQLNFYLQIQYWSVRLWKYLCLVLKSIINVYVYSQHSCRSWQSAIKCTFCVLCWTQSEIKWTWAFHYFCTDERYFKYILLILAINHVVRLTFIIVLWYERLELISKLLHFNHTLFELKVVVKHLFRIKVQKVFQLKTWELIQNFLANDINIALFWILNIVWIDQLLDDVSTTKEYKSESFFFVNYILIFFNHNLDCFQQIQI